MGRFEKDHDKVAFKKMNHNNHNNNVILLGSVAIELLTWRKILSKINISDGIYLCKDSQLMMKHRVCPPLMLGYNRITSWSGGLSAITDFYTMICLSLFFSI